MPTPARRRILDAALNLIQRRGIGRITTREIAVAAGAAEGSLFKNFGDKNGAAHRAGVSAVGANLADNLPAYLAMEPVADGSPLRMAAPAHLAQHRTADHAVGKPGHVVVGGALSRRRPTGPLAYVRGPRVDGRPDPLISCVTAIALAS